MQVIHTCAVVIMTISGTHKVFPIDGSKLTKSHIGLGYQGV